MLSNGCAGRGGVSPGQGYQLDSGRWEVHQLPPEAEANHNDHHNHHAQIVANDESDHGGDHEAAILVGKGPCQKKKVNSSSVICRVAIELRCSQCLWCLVTLSRAVVPS